MDESTEDGEHRRSPLHDRHLALGGRMAPFAGWEMPVDYRESGVIKEHTAVRTAVGIFDVSHLGKVRITGSGAAEYVNGALANDLAKIGPGGAQYTLCCDDATGGIVDDLIAYLYGDDEVFLVPNAANTDEIVTRLADAAPAGVQVADVHERYATIAVQGPESAELLTKLGLPSGHPYMSFLETAWRGTTLVVCRTGYTGEHGYEVVLEAGDATALWDALLDAGSEFGALPCGLGARDTLRTEAGYPLHGQDISLAVTPVQARLAWAVGWKKPSFWGRDVLVAEREQGARRRLWGIEAIDRGIPRPHMSVSDFSDRWVGEVTSGTFSPTRQVGIGFALLDQPLGEGDEVRVDVRGRSRAMRVVKPPFVRVTTK
ncbi:MAG: glycine cleavage system aminomethyltransferase GcvT [Streptosporangiales bacterium]|nr:glycine cleavage system aminomethyltransferase GcvT [Streptosporangiales bacterium]